MKFASYIFSIAAFSAAAVSASPTFFGGSNLLSLLLSPKGLLGTQGLVSDILGTLGLSDYSTGTFIPYDSNGSSGEARKLEIYPYSASAPEGYEFVPSDNYDHDLLQLLLGKNGLLGTHGLVSDILGSLGLSDYDAGTFIPIYQVSDQNGQNNYITGPYTQFPSSASDPYSSSGAPLPYGSGPSDGSGTAPFGYSSNIPDGSYPSGSYSVSGFPPSGSPFGPPGGDFTPIDYHNDNLVSELLGKGGLLSTSGLICDILNKVGLCRLSNHIGYVAPFYSAEKDDFIYGLPFNPYH